MDRALNDSIIDRLVAAGQLESAKNGDVVLYRLPKSPFWWTHEQVETLLESPKET